MLGSLMLAALLPLAAQAKSSDRNAPMDVEADKTDATLDDDSESILSGNVRITQGTLDISADRAVIHRRAGEISQVVLTGGPATLKQLSDENEPMNAQANQIVYTLTSDVVVLTGGVVVQQPRGTLAGETIRYDLKTGRVNGGDDGNRVKMRILPKNQPAGGGN
jgi:lipopolysaccharide export system protein LptA